MHLATSRPSPFASPEEPSGFRAGTPGRGRDGDGGDEVETPLAVLLVEDNAGDAALVCQWLQRAPQAFDVTHVTRLERALDLLAVHAFEVVLLDLSLPDAHDLDGLLAIGGLRPRPPTVVLTGQHDPDLAHRCVKAGAYDVLHKDDVRPGSLQRSIALARTRAELEQARTHLFHADRLNSVGQLAAGVAHEVNNPLQFVSANLHTAAEHLHELDEILSRLPRERDEPSGVLLESIEDALTDARQGAERIESVVRSLGHFSRHDHDEPRALFSINDVVEEACKLVAPQLRRVATLDVGSEPCSLLSGRPSRLVQVLVNLLVNAGQAIEAGPRRPGHVRVYTRPVEGAVEVDVTDDGVGMDEDTLAQIFEPFFTSKGPGEGTGLGLAVSHAIAVDHEGSLTASSTPGEGSHFVLRVPTTLPGEAPAATSRPEAPIPDAGPPSLRVLIVDDEPLVRRVLARILRGHDVVEATDGADALARLRADVDFDAVLCDLTMPGLSGRALYEKVQEEAPELAGRFCFLTGGALHEEDAEFLLAHRALHKPMSVQALRDMLDALGPRRSPTSVE